MTVAGRRSTSADVARLAGVSRATVSYVLNDTAHQSIPEVTRRRVHEAAASLGYTPSAAARSLRRGRTDLVLCLLPAWPVSHSLGELLTLLAADFAAEGLTFVSHQGGDAGGSPAIWTVVTPVAVITFGPLQDSERAAIEATGISVVAALLGGVGLRPGDLDIPEQRLGRLQVEHLASRGHRRLGIAATTEDRLAAFATPRTSGARQACAELGLDDPVTVAVELDPAAAAVAVDTWRDATDPVTGICCYNDEVAMAVLAGMRLRGLTAPRDLAVIGNDDIPAARLTDPPLTTVRRDIPATAAEIVRSVREAMDGVHRPVRLSSVAMDLVLRETA